MAEIRYVTEQEYLQEFSQADSRALELAGNDPNDVCFFLSREKFPCGYKRTPKGRYHDHSPVGRWEIPERVIVITHFMETSCSQLYRSCPRPIVKCFATVHEGDGIAYTITEHKVGECPWKE